MRAAERRGLYRSALWLALGLAVAFVLPAWWARERYNAALAHGDFAAAAALGAGAGARALAAARAAEAVGAHEQAARGYEALRNDARAWPVARFNLAGLYLQRAVAMERERNRDGRGVLIELAKGHYRELLRSWPEHPAVVHNLGIALVLQPDVIARPPEAADAMPERSPRAPVSAPARQRLP